MDQYGSYQQEYAQNVPPQGSDPFGIQAVPQAADEQYQSIPLEPAQELPADPYSVDPGSMEPPGQEPPQLEQTDGPPVQQPQGIVQDPLTETGTPETEPPPPQEAEDHGQQDQEEQPENKDEGLPPPPDLPAE